MVGSYYHEELGKCDVMYYPNHNIVELMAENMQGAIWVFEFLLLFKDRYGVPQSNPCLQDTMTSL
jgi:hypothetical protein